MKLKFHTFKQLGCVLANTTLLFCCPDIPTPTPHKAAAMLHLIVTIHSKNNDAPAVDRADQAYAYRQYFEQVSTSEESAQATHQHPGYDAF